MSNMSYCRYQNTLSDLRECRSAMAESSDPWQGLSKEESAALTKLVRLCRQIGEELIETPG